MAHMARVGVSRRETRAWDWGDQSAMREESWGSVAGWVQVGVSQVGCSRSRRTTLRVWPWSMG